MAAGVARAVAVAEAVAKRSPAQEMLNPQMMRMMRLTHLRKTLDREPSEHAVGAAHRHMLMVSPPLQRIRSLESRKWSPLPLQRIQGMRISRREVQFEIER